MSEVSHDRALSVINYSVVHGEQEALKHFNLSSLETLSRYKRTLKSKAHITPKVLVFDIETSTMLVHVWGIYKQRISPKSIEKDWFVLSWAAKWLFDDKIMSEVVTPEEVIERDDKRIVQKMWELLNRADIVIAHNGKKFDIRKLNARFLYHRMQQPMSYQIIDTLTESRKNFALSSHTQYYITKFLKLPEKLETEYELWLECEKGDAQALRRMVKYNRGDVTGLEEWYVELRPWIKSHPNMNVYVNTDQMICPNCASSNLEWKGFYHTPAGKYKAFRCECGAIGRSRFTELSRKKRRNTVVSVAR